MKKSEKFIALSVGMDISKDDFKVCMMGGSATKERKVIASTRFANTATGFAKFFEWSSKHSCKYNLVPEYLMEATGVYYEGLAWFLYGKSQRVVVVLGNHSKAFIKSEGLKTKNDKIDAKGLALMSLASSRKAWQPMSDTLYRLRSLTRHHEALQKELTRERSRLHALNHSHKPEENVYKSIEEKITFLETQLKKTKELILKTAKEDEKLYQKVEKIRTIPGVGFVTALTIIAETNGFELFSSLKQLTSFAGYDVVQNQSGKYQGKTRISKKGNSHIRRILFMPAFTTVKMDNVFQKLYQRVYDRTKIKMKAYTAVQRKLLCIIYTLWKKDEEFDPQRGQEGKMNTEAQQIQETENKEKQETENKEDKKASSKIENKENKKVADKIENNLKEQKENKEENKTTEGEKKIEDKQKKSRLENKQKNENFVEEQNALLHEII